MFLIIILNMGGFRLNICNSYYKNESVEVRRKYLIELLSAIINLQIKANKDI